MNTKDNRQNAHDMIDRIFHDLLPAHGMAERPEQISLSHLMLDAMADSSIALCDAGTGIGKPYSYLAAGTAFLRFQAASRKKFQPILVSTSSIALQTAIQNEYLPFLSDVLMEDSMMDEPLKAVIRKGKAHYVCDVRLEQRLGQLDLSKKNWKAGRALLSLREQLDMDAASHLSNYDRNRVCVPQVCDCGQEGCRYRSFLEGCAAGTIRSKSATTTSCWRTPFTGERAETPSCRTPAQSSSTRPISCRTPPVRCSAPSWRPETSRR